MKTIHTLLLFVIVILSTTAQADDRLSFGTSLGTPLYLGGNMTAGELKPRNGELPAGYELGIDVSYCVFMHGRWCIGPVAGLHYAYLRAELVNGNELTQGSLQKYGAQFGVRAESRFAAEHVTVLFDATLGPTYIDPHDLASNGHGWVSEAALQLGVLYDNPDWPVALGPYVRVSRMFGIDAPGDRGGKGLKGDLTIASVGLHIKF